MIDHREQVVARRSNNRVRRCEHCGGVYTFRRNNGVGLEDERPLIHRVSMSSECRSIHSKQNPHRRLGHCEAHRKPCAIPGRTGSRLDVRPPWVVHLVQVVRRVSLNSKLSRVRHSNEIVPGIGVAATHEHRSVRKHQSGGVVHSWDGGSSHRLVPSGTWVVEDRAEVRLFCRPIPGCPSLGTIDDEYFSCGKNQHIVHHSRHWHILHCPFRCGCGNHHPATGLQRGVELPFSDIQERTGWATAADHHLGRFKPIGVSERQQNRGARGRVVPRTAGYPGVRLDDGVGFVVQKDRVLVSEDEEVAVCVEVYKWVEVVLHTAWVSSLVQEGEVGQRLACITKVYLLFSSHIQKKELLEDTKAPTILVLSLDSEMSSSYT